MSFILIQLIIFFAVLSLSLISFHHEDRLTSLELSNFFMLYFQSSSVLTLNLLTSRSISSTFSSSSDLSNSNLTVLSRRYFLRSFLSTTVFGFSYKSFTSYSNRSFSSFFRSILEYLLRALNSLMLSTFFVLYLRLSYIYLISLAMKMPAQ